MKTKSTTRIATSALSVFAGMLGIEHGIFEVAQGNFAPDSMLINAIGLPCQSDAVWHACFPALTLIPNYLITGVIAVLVSLSLLAWGVGFVDRRHGWLILVFLSILLMLVGGGFVPTFIGFVAGVTGRYINTSPPKWLDRLVYLSKLWPWSLVLLLIWFPGSWLLGYLFGEVMLAYGVILFFIFDLGLPVLVALSGISYDLIAGDG